MLNFNRYTRVPVLHYPEREWPGKEIEKAPIWCSVDLRDGNQALIEPMNVEEKMEQIDNLNGYEFENFINYVNTLDYNNMLILSVAVAS